MADQRLMDLIDRMGYAGTKGLALANDPSMDNESVALSYGGFLSRGSADA